MSVDLVVSRTGTALLDRFGLEGLAVWICFLAACKRSLFEGEFNYHAEGDALMKLGLDRHPPSFTLETFFTFTGRLKQTRRTRRGRETNVKCTQWGRWQNVQKRPAHGPKIQTEYGRDTAVNRERDRDNDNDSEREAVSATTEAVVTRLSRMGRVDAERVGRIIADFPDHDHLGEATSMVDWTLARGIERKDVARAFLNWLKRAEPRPSGRAPGEIDYPLLDPETV